MEAVSYQGKVKKEIEMAEIKKGDTLHRNTLKSAISERFFKIIFCVHCWKNSDFDIEHIRNPDLALPHTWLCDLSSYSTSLSLRHLVGKEAEKSASPL